MISYDLMLRQLEIKTKEMEDAFLPECKLRELKHEDLVQLALKHHGELMIFSRNFNVLFKMMSEFLAQTSSIIDVAKKQAGA